MRTSRFGKRLTDAEQALGKMKSSGSYGGGSASGGVSIIISDPNTGEEIRLEVRNGILLAIRGYGEDEQIWPLTISSALIAEEPGGLKDSSNRVFTWTYNWTVGIWMINGVGQHPGGVNYTHSGNVSTLEATEPAPAPGDALYGLYLRGF